ncbi:MAG: hypothetical protein JST00_19480 [Deltaproteobacteria bacterium]|nr:hypothetical protein [Deltaproteobacteria bacterium]
MSSIAGRSVVVVASLFLVSAWSVDARAEVDTQVAMGVAGTWMRSMPQLGSPELETSGRYRLNEGKIASRTSLFGVGAFLDLGLTIDDRLVVPLLGAGFYGMVGSYDAVITSVDGSIAQVRPWTTFRLDVPGPGIGYRVKKRRWMFGALARLGLSYMEVGGSIAGATEWNPVTLKAVTPLIQVEVEACRRLDPVTRMCLNVAPRVYDGEFMNGAIFGLRMEWGR